MSARAVWRGVIELGPSSSKVSVPVKLYTAVEDKSVSFRLLHLADGVPVRQVLVNPKTKEVVEYADSERGFVTGEGELVSLDADELEALEPEPSRTIEVLRFLQPGTIEHRWYQRPYYLGPDGDDDAYFTLTAALGREELEGVARWVMRDKEYVGALRLHHGYPMLVTLRYAEDVVPLDEVGPARDATLDDTQVAMAGQLITMLAGEFEPQTYEDEYRAAVLDLIEKKKRGSTIKRAKPRARKATSDLSAALEKSLKQETKSGAGKGAARSSGPRSGSRG